MSTDWRGALMRAVKIRSLWGGMKGDMTMLNECGQVWFRRHDAALLTPQGGPFVWRRGGEVEGRPPTGMGRGSRRRP
jgi:hypothetical protein